MSANLVIVSIESDDDDLPYCQYCKKGFAVGDKAKYADGYLWCESYCGFRQKEFRQKEDKDGSTTTMA